jgi:hypothetical protein
MNSGVSALRAATHSWLASGPERPVRDPYLDHGGTGLSGAEALLDGDQVPRGQRPAAIEDVAMRRLCWVLMRLCRGRCAVVI